MLLARRNNSVSNWLNNWFNDNFFDTSLMPHMNATAPAVNIKEDENAYTMEIAAPGLKKDMFNINSNVVYLDEGESRQQDSLFDETVQEQRRSPSGCHSFAQYHCPHHRLCRRGCRVYQTLWRRILRYHFRHSHLADSGAFRNHPEDHRCFLLALAGNCITQENRPFHSTCQ